VTGHWVSVGRSQFGVGQFVFDGSFWPVPRPLAFVNQCASLSVAWLFDRSLRR